MVQTISAGIVAEQKASKRKHISALINSQKENLVQNKSSRITERFFLLPENQKARNILVYLSLQKEVQTDSLIKRLFEMGKKVFVPIVDDSDKELTISELPSLGINLVKGAFGIPTPSEKDRAIVSPDIIDLAVVPGLAFTRKGDRLGRGKGYYDRLLARFPSHAMKVGVAFGFQVLDFIPIAHHDIGMDVVLSESEIFNC